MLKTGRISGSLLLATLCGTLLLGTGCSLKKDENGRLKVGMAGFIKPHHGKSVLDKAFNGLSSLAIGVQNEDVSAPGGSVKSVFDMDCFALNVRGGIIPTYGMCDENISVGIAESPQMGLSSIFSPIVPASSGVVFEVFGSPPGECPNINGEGGPGSGTVFKIGEVTADLTQNLDSLTIPVSVDMTKVFDCSREPYDVFYENFDYGEFNYLIDVDEAYPYWESDLGSGMADLFLNGDYITQDLADPNGMNFVYTQLENKPYTSIMVYIDSSQITTGAGVEVGVGLAEDFDSATPKSVGCRVFEYDFGTNGYDLGANIGTGSIFPDVSGNDLNSEGFPAGVQGDHYLLCEIRRNLATNMITTTAYVLDGEGYIVNSPTSNTFADTCANNCDLPYLYIDDTFGSLLATDAIFADDYWIQQADFDVP